MKIILSALLALVTVTNATGSETSSPAFVLSEDQIVHGIDQVGGDVRIVLSKFNETTLDVVTFDPEFNELERLPLDITLEAGNHLALGFGILQGGRLWGYIRRHTGEFGRPVIWDATTGEREEPDPELTITHIDNDGVINGANRFSSPSIDIDLSRLAEGLIDDFVWTSPNGKLFFGLGNVVPINLVFRTSEEQEWTVVEPADTIKVPTPSFQDDFAILWLPASGTREVPTALRFFEPKNRTLTPVEEVTGDNNTREGIIIGDRFYWYSGTQLSYTPLADVLSRIGAPQPETPVITITDVPKIAITAAEGNIVLTWPASGKELRLESSTDMNAWKPVETTPTGDETKEVTVPADQGMNFFRLVPKA